MSSYFEHLFMLLLLQRINCSKQIKFLISSVCSLFIQFFNSVIFGYILHLYLTERFTYYWQHCAQCNASVFKLLRGRFSGFLPHRATRCTNGVEIWHGGGDPQNWNFYWDLIKMWNINTLQGHISCSISQNLQFVPRFRMHQLLKFHWICSRGYWVIGVLSWRGGSGYPQIFSAP